MKTSLLLAITAILIIAACSTSKKSTTSSASATTPTTSTPSISPTATLVASSNMYMVPKAPLGMYQPGSEELTAIQLLYKDATMSQLQEGHYIYTVGACIQCHGTTNIYTRNETQWKEIIEDMSLKARLSETQKDAVYKYVLAIKATQPK